MEGWGGVARNHQQAATVDVITEEMGQSSPMCLSGHVPNLFLLYKKRNNFMGFTSEKKLLHLFKIELTIREYLIIIRIPTYWLKEISFMYAQSNFLLLFGRMLVNCPVTSSYHCSPRPWLMTSFFAAVSTTFNCSNTGNRPAQSETVFSINYFFCYPSL